MASAGTVTWLEVAGSGAAGLSSVWVVSWLSQFCLLESGRAKLVVHTPDAWDGKAGTATMGQA